MFDKLSTVEAQYEELTTRLGTTEVQSDPTEYRRAAKALSDLEPLVLAYREYRAVQKDIEGSEELLRGAFEGENLITVTVKEVGDQKRLDFKGTFVKEEPAEDEELAAVGSGDDSGEDGDE